TWPTAPCGPACCRCARSGESRRDARCCRPAWPRRRTSPAGWERSRLPLTWTTRCRTLRSRIPAGGPPRWRMRGAAPRPGRACQLTGDVARWAGQAEAMTQPGVDEVAEELYGQPPAEFTAARDARAAEA